MTLQIGFGETRVTGNRKYAVALFLSPPAQFQRENDIGKFTLIVFPPRIVWFFKLEIVEVDMRATVSNTAESDDSGPGRPGEYAVEKPGQGEWSYKIYPKL